MSELGKRCLAVAAAAACGLVALTTAPAIAGERGGTQLDRGRLDTAPADYAQYRRNMVYVEPGYLGSNGYYYVGGQYVDNIRDPAGGTYLQKSYVYYTRDTWDPMGPRYR